MTQQAAAVASIEFGRRVAEAIGQLGFEVTLEPSRETEGSSWQKRIVSWLTEQPSYSIPRPDMRVASGEKAVLVEAKPYPILLGPIIQTKHFADYYDMPAIICVPDDAYQKISASVHEWAELNDIVLSPIGEIGDKLKMMLQESGG